MMYGRVVILLVMGLSTSEQINKKDDTLLGNDFRWFSLIIYTGC